MWADDFERERVQQRAQRPNASAPPHPGPVRPRSPDEVPAGVLDAVVERMSSARVGAAVPPPATATRIQRSQAGGPNVIRRLWSKADLYRQGGGPSIKARLARGGSTYIDIGAALDAYHELADDDVDARLEALERIVELSDQWLTNPEHEGQADAKQAAALRVLVNQAKRGTPRTIFIDLMKRRFGVDQGTCVQLELMVSDFGGLSFDAVRSASGTGAPHDDLKRLIAFPFVEPKYRANVALSRVLVQLWPPARCLVDQAQQLFPNIAHRKLVVAYLAQRITTSNELPAQAFNSLEGDNSNAEFLVWRMIERGEAIGGEFAGVEFQRALATRIPTAIRKLGELIDQNRRQLMPLRPSSTEALATLDIARVAFDGSDFARARVRLLEGEQKGQVAIGAQMSATNDDVANPPLTLGGALNEVIRTDFPDGAGTFTGFFKKEVPEVGAKAAAKAQMDTAHFRQGNRTMATTVLDRLLGSDVIPRTEWAQRNGVFGTVMAVVDGNDLSLNKAGEGDTRVPKAEERIAAKRTEDWLAPEMQRGLSNLQLLDAITGQLDRHPGNIFVIERDGMVLSVQGIDNDLAFSEVMLDPNMAFYDAVNAQRPRVPLPAAGGAGSNDPRVSHNVGIPRYIDKRLADRIGSSDFSDDAVRRALEPLLTDGEINATLSRLRVIRDYIRDNPDRLVDKIEDWNRNVAKDTLNEPRSEYTSYWARDVKSRAEAGRVDIVEINRQEIAPQLEQAVPVEAAAPPQPDAAPPSQQRQPRPLPTPPQGRRRSVNAEDVRAMLAAAEERREEVDPAALPMGRGK